MKKQLELEIKSVFDLLINRMDGSWVEGKYKDSLTFKLDGVIFEFIHDIHHDELGAIVYEDLSGRYFNLLDILNNMKSEETRDVFDFLKSEYNNIEIDLKEVVLNIKSNHSLFIIATASILLKYFEKFKSEYKIMMTGIL